MLSRAAWACAALVLGCANIEPPPGGPPDTAPPRVTAVRPESGAVVRDMSGDVEIRFDEVVDEMAGGAAGNTLDRYVVLSPVAGKVRVRWSRSEILVRPREGWKQGRVYRLELRPGLLDLRRNVLKEGKVVLFSTGPAIPNGVLAGTVVQWMEQSAAPEALIQAALLPDTAPYVTFADSTGVFRLAGLPAGRYAVVAVVDANKNGERDAREAYDSTIVTLDSTAQAILWTHVHDTVGPRIRTADHVDSLSSRLVFSQPLDPAQPLDTARVHVLALPDSTPVPIRAILTPAQFDSLVSAARAAADTAAPPPPRAPPPSRGPGLVRAGAPPTAAGDTAALRALLRRRPAPTDRVVLRWTANLTPGAKYLVRVRGARNLNGAVGDGEAVLSVPLPPPPSPPRAPADTARRP